MGISIPPLNLLVIAPERPAVFVHRRRFQTVSLRLGLGYAHPDDGALVETVEVDARVPYALCVGPEAPPASAILAELQSTAAPS